MYNYSDRIRSYIEERMNVTCEIRTDLIHMNYIMVVKFPFSYEYMTKISDAKLSNNFILTMMDVINELRFEWQMLITKA